LEAAGDRRGAESGGDMIFHFAGRHAAFVWAAYGVTAPVIAALVIESLARARRWRRAVEAHDAKPDEPQEKP
jgi:heme exporter protein D